MMRRSQGFGVGDWVEVRTKREILQTLDENGQLEGMPFMPEMFQFCGKRYQVYKKAHKTCDPDWRSRRIEHAVHLQTRCDGQQHDGCQAGCLIFWKEAWLKPVGHGVPNQDVSTVEPVLGKVKTASSTECTESNVWGLVRISNAEGTRYVCQTTQVLHAGKPIHWWDIRQYLEDWSSGNVTFWELFRGFVYSMYYNLSQSGLGLGPAMRWFYDKACPLWRGSKWPRTKGTIREGEPTPTAALNLQVGELVRVKSHEEILKTVNTASRNRGLWWDAELVPYCNGAFRVLKRVTKVIDERTGKMLQLKNPSIILDSVVCKSRYSACRMFCPRNTYTYWREIWLERTQPGTGAGEGQVDEDKTLSSAGATGAAGR
jgi:hypothetical protein